MPSERWGRIRSPGLAGWHVGVETDPLNRATRRPNHRPILCLAGRFGPQVRDLPSPSKQTRCLSVFRAAPNEFIAADAVRAEVPSGRAQQSALQSRGDSRGTIRHSELFVRVRKVGLHCGVAEIEPTPDLE